MPLDADASYQCPFCGETNYVGVDPLAARRRQFIEDCPVCCSPIAFTVSIDSEGDAVVERAERAD